MASAEQLLLNLRPRPDARFADFAGPSYTLLIEAAQALLQTPGAMLYVQASPGLGRSHLLAALCAEAEARALHAILLPLRELMMTSPAALAGLEDQDMVCLDDLEAIKGHRDWEEALFHWFNQARTKPVRLVFSAGEMPMQLGLTLPDLASRLAQAPAWRLPSPDDASRQALLKSAGQRRGLVMEPEVIRYLVQRGPREPGALLALLERLDHGSLAEGRRLTIPYIRQWLGAEGALATEHESAKSRPGEAI
jgi:DnaA family protein